MVFLRQTALIFCLLLTTTASALRQQSESDSLQSALTHTADPGQRVQLLLELKDLNEDTNLKHPYSIQLFREAASIGDTYAMSVAITPIISRYANYTEKQDSVHYYVRTLGEMTPGTPEEGIDQYAEMSIALNRLYGSYGRERSLKLSHAIQHWCDSLDTTPYNIFKKAKILLIRGYAQSQIDYYEHGVQRAYISQIGLWKEAYELTRRMPGIDVRQNFANNIYFLLSGAYNQAGRYDDQVALARDYIRMLDSYYADKRLIRRRPYLYTDNSYVLPYQQLIRCAINIGREDYSKQHFSEFRRRMLDAKGKNLTRNKTYLYEMGYLWKGVDGEYDLSIQYGDSLIQLIESGKSYFDAIPNKFRKVYRDRARILYFAGRYDESYNAYARASHIQDSLFAVEREERAQTIRRSHEMDRLKLDETRAMIRNRAMATLSFVTIGLLLLATGAYLYRILRRNRRLQTDILRHSRKAHESEHMKSTFINTICRNIQSPLEMIDQSVQMLMVAETDSRECLRLQTAVRENTEILLSTVDNMLEAANLDSLTERLRFEKTDIDELCRAELLAASRLRHNPLVSYIIDAPGTRCIISTHAKYFAFVVRALLNNAGKFTREGCITLGYEQHAKELRVTVTDTGCGIPHAKHAEIFRPFCADTAASQGLSLALCCLIAEYLSGSLRPDETYTAGTRVIFTIPV